MSINHQDPIDMAQLGLSGAGLSRPGLSEIASAPLLTALPGAIDDLPLLRDILASHGVDRVSFGDGELLTPDNRMARMDNGAVLVFRYDDLRALAPEPRLINVPADVYVDMYFAGPPDAPLSPEERRNIEMFQRNQVFTASPQVHRLVKPITAKPFMPSAMGGFATMAAEAAAETMDRFLGKGEFDFQEGYGQSFAFAFWRRFLDMTQEEADRLRGLMAGMAANGSRRHRSREGLLHYDRTVPQYFDLLVTVMRRARANGKNAWLDWRAAQFAALESPPADVPDSAEHALATDMIDGFHALGIGIANCAYAAFGNPGAYRAMREDPTLVGKAVSEALRLYAPVRLIARYASQAIDFEGMHIPQGTVLWLYWGAGNRDPLAFARPDTFDMMRTEPAITFGGGAQICPGRNLVRTLAMAALAPLLAPDVNVEIRTGEVEWMLGMPITGGLVPDRVPARIERQAS